MTSCPIVDIPRPERLRSGLFAALVCAAAAWSGPATLLIEELLDPPFIRPPCASGPGSRYAAFHATYHDVYAVTIADTGANGVVRQQTAISAPRLSGTAGIDRRTWGLSATVHAGGMFADMYNVANGYDLRIDAPMNVLSGSGWLRWNVLTLSGATGYDHGLDATYRYDGKNGFADRIGAIPADPRFMHALTGSCTFPHMSIGMYECKRPFLSVLAALEKTSNHSTYRLPLAASDQEFGVFETLHPGADSLAVSIGILSTHSDRGPQQQSTLPLAVSGRGNRLAMSATGSRLPASPRISGVWHYRAFGIRGYDGKATAPYVYLDSMRFSHAGLTISGRLPWLLNADLFAEYATLSNARHGQFDPYPFSGFTIFNPVKYRIDTTAFLYQTAGASIERSFAPVAMHQATVRLSVAWLNLSGSLKTREYDFSFFLPRLINPRTWSLIDERRLLITPEFHYALTWHGYSFSPSLRQVIPLDLASLGEGGAHRPRPSTKRTIHGGTTISLSVEYRR